VRLGIPAHGLPAYFPPLRKAVASAVKVTFAELYRSAFAETDPDVKQRLLQQVQSQIDTWHFEQQKNNVGHSSLSEPPTQIAPMLS
jgi:hypothetical protein